MVNGSPEPVQLPMVMWVVEGDLTDNVAEIEDFLAPFHARCKRVGDKLLLQAWGGLNTELEPGDCLVLAGDKLGIIRTEEPGSPAQTALDS